MQAQAHRPLFLPRRKQKTARAPLRAFNLQKGASHLLQTAMGVTGEFAKQGGANRRQEGAKPPMEKAPSRQTAAAGGAPQKVGSAAEAS